MGHRSRGTDRRSELMWSIEHHECGAVRDFDERRVREGIA
jgi:hypothetical protein